MFTALSACIEGSNDDETRLSPTTVTRRAGFSFLEVLIALLVLSIGILAIAKSMAAMNRLVAVGAVFTRASATAANKMESLLSDGCPPLSLSGDSSAGTIRLAWSARSAGDRSDIRVIVFFPHAGSGRSDTLFGLRSCHR